jgi:hypothetical protein
VQSAVAAQDFTVLPQVDFGDRVYCAPPQRAGFAKVLRQKQQSHFLKPLCSSEKWLS